MSQYLYFGPRLDGFFTLTTDALERTTERHHLTLGVGESMTGANPLEVVRGLNGTGAQDGINGIVIAMASGLPDRQRLEVIEAALTRGLRAWLYWPAEQAVECVDRERLESLKRHRHAVIALEKVGRRAHRVMKTWERVKPGLRWIYRGAFPVRRFDMLADLERLSLDARPVPFRGLRWSAGHIAEGGRGPVPPDGFLGADHLGRELRPHLLRGEGTVGVTEQFVCLLAQPFKLLDDLGVSQVVMDAPTTIINEDAIVSATTHYYPIVKTACDVLRPSYIYERLCLGNYAAALVSRELQIPYIIEYNGSEISMQKSFDKTAPFYADVYLKAEEVAFRQATLISVISEHVRNDLVSRGVDARKILVNPNGADLDSYAPADPTRRSGRSAPGSGSPSAIASSDSPARSAAGTASTCWPRRFRGSARPTPMRSSSSSATANTSRSSTPRSSATGLAPGSVGRPRAPGRRRAAAAGVRHLRVAAQHAHGGRQVLRLADEDLRIHGHGRRHRRERPRADRRGAVAGVARRRSVAAAT